MNVEQLLSQTSSLEFLQGSKKLELSKLSGWISLSKNSVVFIREESYLEKISQQAQGFEADVCLIVLKSVYESCKEKILNDFDTIILTPDYSQSVCEVSKIFYDLKYEKINFNVDGRQMGSAVVDSSCEISQNVFIGEHTILGKNVKVYPGVVVMPYCKIGDNTVIYPNATINSFVEIGKNVQIHSGVVIGADGFGYNQLDNKHEKIWHIGGVLIEDNVEIGANSCIDGGTFSPTIIKRGTKIDNLVQVAHNCQIGEDVILCSQVGLGGSSEVGDNTMFGGKSGLADGKSLGKECLVGANAIILSSFTNNSRIAGFPAKLLKDWVRENVFLKDAAKSKEKLR